VWGVLLSGLPGLPAHFDLPGELPAGDWIPIEIGLVGSTDHTHDVTAWINGQYVGQASFAGKGVALLSGEIAAGALMPTGNQLTFTYELQGADPGALGFTFFDFVDLQVALPVSESGARVESLGTYDAALADQRPSDARGAEGYLIVTHGLFADQAQRLAELKADEGYQPEVVDVERAYDSFSSGVREAQAVRALIARRAASGALRHVLLVGDDTFDYKDHLGMGLRSFIPSLNSHDGLFGYIPSENRYADLNGDGGPDVSIGRLPVQTPEQAELLVDKIATQGPWLAGTGGRHIFAVDNHNPGDVVFRQRAEEVVAALQPESIVWADVSEGIEAARQALIDGLRDGAVATHYFGHGGHEAWADEALLTPHVVDSLAGSERATVLFTWACQTQWYQYHLGPSVNEALLLVPEGGALAALGPSGVTRPVLQAKFYERVYDGFAAGLSLGEAVRRAKREALEDDPEASVVVEGWSLLGDPSLRLSPAAGGGRR